MTSLSKYVVLLCINFQIIFYLFVFLKTYHFDSIDKINLSELQCLLKQHQYYSGTFIGRKAKHFEYCVYNYLTY